MNEAFKTGNKKRNLWIQGKSKEMNFKILPFVS